VIVPANFELDSKSALSRKPYAPMAFLTYLCQASSQLKFCGRLETCVACLVEVVVCVVVVVFVVVLVTMVGVVRSDDVLVDFDGGVCFVMYPFDVSIS